jgi:hypothetical protein
VSDGLLGEVVSDHPAVISKPIGRKWPEIGMGLAAGFALTGICAIGIWALVVLVGALA